MKIDMNNCLQLTSVFLQQENVLSLLGEEQGENLSGEDRLQAEKELSLLLRCANLVIHEIASEYVHLKTSEKFVSQDGHINYSDFIKQPVDIYAVKKDDSNCRFKLYPTELITDKGEIEVFFTYLPGKVELGGSLDFEEGKMNSRIVAYGTAAEYCIISGMYDESLIWDKRYKDSLFNATKSLKSVVIPARRWG